MSHQSSVLKQILLERALNFVMENLVNFNHLIEKRILMRSCHALGHNECYYQPASPGRATSGKNVHVQMKCKHCDHREDIFLSESQYSIHSKILQRETTNV